MKALIVFATLLFVGSAFGDEAGRGMSDVTTIQDGEGRGRILLRWDSSLEGNVAVWKARLRFELAGEPTEGVLPIVIYPITTPWNSGAVGWSSGWENPGGDFDDELFARAEIDLGGGPASVDVTTLVKEIAESDYSCEGFIVTLDPSAGSGFTDADLGRLANLDEGTIDVSYRSTPPLPRAAIGQGEN